MREATRRGSIPKPVKELLEEHLLNKRNNHENFLSKQVLQETKEEGFVNRVFLAVNSRNKKKQNDYE